MNWLPALPAALLTAAWVLAPGLVAAYAIGLRGIAAWGTAPVVSIGSLALGALVASLWDIRWTPAVAAAAALLLATVAIVMRAASRPLRSRLRSPRVLSRDRWAVAAALIGMSGAVILGGVTAMVGMHSPDAIAQSIDSVFHYNAVAEILARGDASPMAVGRLTDPSSASAFYPAAWHDLVSLLVLTGSVSVPLASNVAALVVTAVVWPLSCLLLVRQVVGRSAAAALVTPFAAVGFLAFPWSLLVAGVLWPNLLGFSLVPVGLAAVVSLCGLAQDSVFTKVQALGVVAVSIVALTLAHPNALFGLAVVALAPGFWWLATQLKRLNATGRVVLATSTTLVALGLAAGGLRLLLVSPLARGVMSFDWPAYQSPAQAVGEVVLNATNHKDAAWAISLVVLLGGVAAVVQPATRWLVPAHLLFAMLFVLASSLETRLAAALTAVWYNDPYRLAAMIPITAVPLAVLGVLALGRQASAALAGDYWDGRIRSRLRRATRPGVASAGVLAILILLTSGMYVRDHAKFLKEPYPEPQNAHLVTPAQRAFLEDIGSVIPPDAIVAENPWDGSVLLPTLTGRSVLFPHLNGHWTAEQLYVAQHLRDVETDPRLCPLLAQLGVGYVLIGESRFFPDDPGSARYPGLDLPANAAGFELVKASGRNALYRITACGRQPAS